MSYAGRLEPLYPASPVELSYEELRAQAVDAIGGWSRENIWQGFEKFCSELRMTGLSADIYIGGSFVTHRRDPSDIDFSVGVNMPPSNYHPQQIAYLQKVQDTSDDWKRKHRCDFEIFIEHPAGPSLMEMIDPKLNFFCTNDQGPPKRTILVRVGA